MSEIDVNELRGFLDEQVAEDEHFARRTRSGEWTFDELGQLLVNQGQTISKISNLGVANFGWHIARHDPARVLREVMAKRRIMARHSRFPWADGGSPHARTMCAGCGEDGDEPVTAHIDDCPELRDLASAYEDRPGWKERWRVS